MALETPSSREKVLSGLAEAAGVAANIRRAGKSIVLTSGRFGTLGAAHVRVLEAARALGDYLFVGVTGGRAPGTPEADAPPAAPQVERAEVLAALEAVDFVLTLDADTADGAVHIIRPDVFAGWGDFTEESVPERPAVLSYGGRVAIVGGPEAHLTKDGLTRL